MLRHDIVFVYIVLDKSMDASDDWRSLLQLNITVITSYSRPRAGGRVTNIPAQLLLHANLNNIDSDSA